MAGSERMTDWISTAEKLPTLNKFVELLIDFNGAPVWVKGIRYSEKAWQDEQNKLYKNIEVVGWRPIRHGITAELFAEFRSAAVKKWGN